MARAVDYDLQEQLAQLLAGGRQPASYLSDNDELDALYKGQTISNNPSVPGIKKLDQSVIEPETIKEQGVKLSPNADFVRKNYNDLQNYQHTNLQSVADRAKISEEEKGTQLNIDDSLLKTLARGAANPDLINRSNSDFGSAAYQKALMKKLKDLENPRPSVDDQTKMLYAAIPTILGTAAPGAGLKALEFGQKDLADIQKQASDERKSKIEGLGKEILGAAELRKAETEQDKEDFERQKFNLGTKQKSVDLLVNYSKWLSDNKQKDSIESQKQFLDQYNKMNQATEKGINETSDVSMKEAELASGEAKAKLQAQAAAKRQQTKPPTESQTKAAHALGVMRKANEAYDRMVKDIGGEAKMPSRTSGWYEFQKMLNESPSATTVMGLMSKSKATPAMKRQIQSELEFLAAKLRKESGAAINVGEYISEGSQYFPRTMDDSKTLQEKNASRKTILGQMELDAGSAPVVKAFQPDYAKSSGPETKVINGITYQKVNGGWKKVK